MPAQASEGQALSAAKSDRQYIDSKKASRKGFVAWLAFNCLFFFSQREREAGDGGMHVYRISSFLAVWKRRHSFHSVAAAPLGALLSLCLLAQSLLPTLSSILICQAALSKRSRSSLRTVILSYPFQYISRELATRWDSQLKAHACLAGDAVGLVGPGDLLR